MKVKFKGLSLWTSIYLIVIQLPGKSHQDESAIMEENIIKSNYLYKCSEQVPEQSLNLPPALQYPYPNSVALTRLNNLARIFNKSVDSLYNFELVPKSSEKLDCFDGNFTLEIPTYFDSARSSTFNFTPDGFMGYYEYKQNENNPKGVVREEIYFHRENFCVSSLNESVITLKVCKSQCFMHENEMGRHPCLPKCCRLSRVMTLETCLVAMEKQWEPSIYSNLKSKTTSTIYPNFYHNFVDIYWNCTKHNTTDLRFRHNSTDLRLLLDGGIYTKNSGESNSKFHQGYPTRSKTRDFCIDGLWDKSQFAVYNPQLEEQVTWSCKRNKSEDELKEEEDQIKERQLYNLYVQIVFGMTLVASMLYMLIIGIYILLWKKQNLHGYTLFAFGCSQFLLNFVRTILYGAFIFNFSGGNLQSICIVAGILLHFLIISSFSWTTVVAFDVWFKIRSMRPTSSLRSKKIKRLALYFGFGLGIPTIIVVIALSIEFGLGEEEDDSVIKPGYVETCVVSKFWAYVYYISITITTLFVTNMILVLDTIRNIWNAKKQMTKMKDSATSSNAANNASLAGKLFVLMGFFLIFEITIALVNPVIRFSIYFVILELYRIVQAFALLHIFHWNKKTWEQIVEKIPLLKPYTPSGWVRDPEATTTAVVVTNSEL